MFWRERVAAKLPTCYRPCPKASCRALASHFLPFRSFESSFGRRFVVALSFAFRRRPSPASKFPPVFPFSPALTRYPRVPNPIELGARAGPVYGEATEGPCLRTLPHFPTLLFPHFSSMAWCVFLFHVFLCTCLQCLAPSRVLWLRRTSRVPIGCVGRLFFSCLV